MVYRRLMIRAVAVLAMGISFFAMPREGRAVMLDGEEGGHCIWCTNICPADLEAFCFDKCSGAEGGVCDSDNCHGRSGQWWENTVTCDDPT